MGARQVGPFRGNQGNAELGFLGQHRAYCEKNRNNMAKVARQACRDLLDGVSPASGTDVDPGSTSGTQEGMWWPQPGPGALPQTAEEVDRLVCTPDVCMTFSRNAAVILPDNLNSIVGERMNGGCPCPLTREETIPVLGMHQGLFSLMTTHHQKAIYLKSAPGALWCSPGSEMHDARNKFGTSIDRDKPHQFLKNRCQQCNPT